MTLCPIAIAVGCRKCPVFTLCPVKGLLGDVPKAAEVKAATPARPRPAAKAPAAVKPRAAAKSQATSKPRPAAKPQATGKPKATTKPPPAATKRGVTAGK